MGFQQLFDTDSSSDPEVLRANATRLKKENDALRAAADKWKAVLAKEASLLVVSTGASWPEAEKLAEKKLLGH